MKKYVAGDHNVTVQFYPNPAMLGLHTTINLDKLRGNMSTLHALNLIENIDGVESKSNKTTKSRYELHLEVGLAFNREQIAEQAASALLSIVHPDIVAQLVDDSERPFTVIGVYNNYSIFGPDTNGDGELKLASFCVMATSKVNAKNIVQIEVDVDRLPSDHRDYSIDSDLLDSVVCFEGNPLRLLVINPRS